MMDGAAYTFFIIYANSQNDNRARTRTPDGQTNVSQRMAERRPESKRWQYRCNVGPLCPESYVGGDGSATELTASEDRHRHPQSVLEFSDQGHI